MSMTVSIGISNDNITATSRNAPISEYLLFDDQPAMMIESVPIAPAAMIYNTPMFKSVRRGWMGASGTTAHRINTDIIERIGARLYNAPCRAFGRGVFFNEEFDDVGERLDQPERSDPIRPDAGLEARDHLALDPHEGRYPPPSAGRLRMKMPRKPTRTFAQSSGIPQPAKIPSNQSAATLRGSLRKSIIAPAKSVHPLSSANLH
jgi:hypothetical protein